jgi:hypothetical protein
MALLAGVTACNIPLTSDAVYPLAVPMMAAAATEEIRTAVSGEILLAQPVAHASFLKLENTVVPTERVYQGVVTYTPKMEGGQLFYPAVRVGDVSGMVICSVADVTTYSGGFSGPRSAFPVCLDMPKDSLTRKAPTTPEPSDAAALGAGLWLKNGAAASTGFIYFDLQGSLAKGAEGPNFTLAEPARIQPAGTLTEASPTAPKIAIRYLADDKGARLSSVYLVGEQVLTTERKDVPLPAAEKLPQTLTIAGAVVELLAVTDGVLAYRIKQGFPSDTGAIADLPG